MEWRVWIFSILRFCFEWLKHIVKVLVSLSTIINHHYVDDHHALCQIWLLFHLILFLLKGYDTFDDWFSALFVRKSKNTRWYRRNRNRSITLDLTSQQKPINSLSKNVYTSLSFVFLKDRSNNIGNLFTFVTKSERVDQSDITFFKGTTIIVYDFVTFVLE
jgi:hypothetical protein